VRRYATLFEVRKSGILLVRALSDTVNRLSIQDGPAILAGSTPSTIGHAISQALNLSRENLPAPKPGDLLNEETMAMFRHAGVRSWQGFDRAVRSVAISQDESGYSVQPEANTPDQGFIPMPEESIALPLASSESDLGRVASEALQKATFYSE